MSDVLDTVDDEVTPSSSRSPTEISSSSSSSSASSARSSSPSSSPASSPSSASSSKSFSQVSSGPSSAVSTPVPSHTLPAGFLSPLAALKLLLHASKYQASPVFGLLLAATSLSSASSAAAASVGYSSPGDKLVIQDVVPLFHTHPLPAMTETALSFVQQYALTQNLKIVGSYSCPSSPVATLMAKRMANTLPGGAVALTMQPDQFLNLAMAATQTTASPATLCLTAHFHGANDALLAADAGVVVTPSARSVLRTLLQAGAEADVSDFDDFLNSGAELPAHADWLVNARLTQWVAKAEQHATAQ